MKTILVPIDFSRASAPVVAEAAALGRALKARIIVLHVIQTPILIPDFGMTINTITEYMAGAGKGAVQPLARVCAQLWKRGLRARAERDTGFPAIAILEAVRRHAAFLIVMGSHGHSAFHDLLVGSTTGGVLRRASCPVVVVPTPRKKVET